MPLKGRVCRIAATPLSENVWITDDILKNAWNRWVQSCVGQRYASAIPGPLEARKRSTKRRMTELRPTASGLGFHPGFLAGLNQEQDSQLGWKWQPPTVPTSYDPAMVRKDTVDLPPWLIAPDAAEEEEIPAEVPSKSSQATVANRGTTVVAESATPEPHQRPRPKNPVEQAAGTNDLDEMRKIIGKIRVDKYALRRKCSIVAFENLVRSGCTMDRIVEFLGDRTLNQRGARNLTFFVAYCLETTKYDEMRTLCKWMAQQLYVGRYSDSALLLVLQSLSNAHKQDELKNVLEDFCVSTVQALRSSPVVHTEYLKLKTWSSFLAILLHDVYSEQLLSVGRTFVETSSPVQLDHLTEKIGPLVEHWMDSWEPSEMVQLAPASQVPTITTMLQMLPLDKLCETVIAVSWRLLNTLPSGKDVSTLWLKQSIWWSAVRSPEIFRYVGKSDSWSAIAATLRKRQDEYNVSIVITKIDEQLKQSDLGAAHTTMVQCPQMTYDRYPDLAEALILSSERDAKTALEMLRSRQPAALTEVQSICGSRPLEQIRLERIELLERMASLYAQAPHIKPSFAFRCVYECWKLQKQGDLGPVRPAMARALIHSGFVRPLQTGRRLVSHARFEWILLQVAEAEGKDEMRKIGAAVWQWREDIIRQMQQTRNDKRQDALSRQWRQQATTQRDPGHWGALRAMASAGKLPASKHPHSVEHNSPSNAQRHVATPTFRLPLRGLAIKDGIEQDSAFFSPLETSPFQPSSEDIGEDTEVEPSTWTPLDTAISTSAMSATPEPGITSKGYVETYASGFKPPGQQQGAHPRVEHTAPVNSETTPRPQTSASQPSSKRTGNSPRRAAAEQQQQQRRPPPAQKPDALLLRLNRASPLPLSSAGTAFDARPELPAIPACSLAAAAAASSSQGRGGKGLVTIRRVVGTGVIHGANGGEDPMTLSTAMQPAVGTGVGVVVGGSGVEGFGGEGWRW